ncbi:MAG TPA: hypothetical protein VGL13_12120 [Polyangiaceae bacterium]|jgi:hypothetical protein
MKRAAMLVMLAAGCGRHATPAECNALLDRYVELLVRQQDPEAAPTELSAKKQEAHDKAMSDAAFAACPKEVGAGELQCAMVAVNVDEFEKCLE